MSYTKELAKQEGKSQLKKKKYSRPAKRELKRLDTFLRTLVITFLEFRLKQTDKESEAVANKFSEIESKWLDVCKAKWTYVVPKRTAFAERVNSIVNSLEKKKNEDE